MSEWISDKDRLPENSGEYIVVACDEGCPYGEGIWHDTVGVCDEYAFDGWTWYEGPIEYSPDVIVTHWMPLPEAPDIE